LGVLGLKAREDIHRKLLTHTMAEHKFVLDKPVTLIQTITYVYMN
jgi:hypothetical protein